MSINAVQFQDGLSMPDFVGVLRHRSLVLSRALQLALAARLSLPVCTGPARSRFKRGVPFTTNAARAGTMFQDTKLPLRTWMLAAPAYLDQDEYDPAGADAPSGHQLQERLADEAQDHAGHGRARSHAQTDRFLVD